MSRLVLTGSGRIRHNELGVIHYVVRSRAKRFVARWKPASCNFRYRLA